MRAPDTILPRRAEGLGFSAGGIAILSDVSLTLEAGSPSIIIGPNGAVKSVLLRLLHGLLAPSTGRVLWAGDAARRQAMVFQRPVLLRRSVLANAVYPLKLAGVVAAEREPRARAALEMVGLAALADRPARRLSGGEQQRLALARAAAPRPAILLADEPTGNLDSVNGAAIMDLIFGLQSRHGATLIMVTHAPELAARCGRTIRLVDGRIAADSAAVQP
jgi:tungstate transport system ATP-binding protein